MSRTAVIAWMCGIAALTAAGEGSYHAWQGGLLAATLAKPPPNAPVPENFLAALRAGPVAAQQVRSACVHFSPHTKREVDLAGRPGQYFRNVPGFGFMAIAKAGDDSRIANVRRALDVLSQAGLYSASDFEIDDGTGFKVAARAYSLTVAGWERFDRDDCIRVGTPQVTEISEFVRILPDDHRKQVYEVKAKYEVTQIAPWFDDPAIRSLLDKDDVAKLRAPSTISARLERTDSGWRVDRRERIAPELTKEDALGLIAKRRGRLPQACIDLPRPDASLHVEITPAPYSATLFDLYAQLARDPRETEQLLSNVLLWQGRFAQLVKSGVFSEQRLDADPARNLPARTRFALEPSWQPWLDLGDANCLRMGEGALEVVSLQAAPPESVYNVVRHSNRAVAKLMLRLDKGAWIEKIAVALPEVDAVRAAGGMPIYAFFGWNQFGDDVWRLESLATGAWGPKPLRTRASPAQAAVAPSPQAGSPVATAAAEGDVVWRRGVRGRDSSDGSFSDDGLTVRYCCTGDSSTTAASRSVESGKFYAEFAFHARVGALVSSTLTSIGVTADPQHGRSPRVARGSPTMFPTPDDPIRHRDVIGIAVDLDDGQLYFSRNGAWVNGRPGAGGGTPLVRGLPYVIVAQVARTSLPSSDTFTANFGKTQFRYDVPRGYRSYDGRQRQR